MTDRPVRFGTVRTVWYRYRTSTYSTVFQHTVRLKEHLVNGKVGASASCRRGTMGTVPIFVHKGGALPEIFKPPLTKSRRENEGWAAPACREELVASRWF